jgi:FMN-dependent NADH-azoreductase/GNAT superfamily N-acetyltransferase
MILFINACVRSGSRTKRLADHVLSRWDDSIVEIRLADMVFAPTDEAYLDRRDRLLAEGDVSDPIFGYAKQFAAADRIVIAAPYWDLSFPAVLKQYLEKINVPGITFCYTPEGYPMGLCRAKELVYVTTAGGAYVPEEFGFGYVKALAQGFYGIEKVRLVQAVGLDIEGADPEKILRESAEKAAKTIAANGKILIRDFSESDLPLMLKWLTDERVLEYYEGRDANYTPETLAEDYLGELPGGFRVIFEYEGAPIGYGQAYRLSGDMFDEYDYPETGRAVFAMDQFIGEPEYWGRGIGTAILKLMCAYLKDERGAERILLDPHKRNGRAIRAYEKAGFRIIKSLPAHELFEGKAEDCLLMELDCEEMI